jgi:ribosomal protein S18 acetylase RimI-like enzyme
MNPPRPDSFATDDDGALRGRRGGADARTLRSRLGLDSGYLSRLLRRLEGCLWSYFAELDTRFDDGFDPDMSIRAEAEDLVPPAGLLLVAWLDGHPVGCGGLKFHGRGPAEIKRMWVSPSLRGLALGRRMLRELERAADEAGATAVRLETNQRLTEAVGLYHSSGYREVPAFNDEAYAHRWFEKVLAGRHDDTGRDLNEPAASGVLRERGVGRHRRDRDPALGGR